MSNLYIEMFISMAENLLEKHLKIIGVPINRKMQLVKCISIMETIIVRKCLAYIKLKNSVDCTNCSIRLVIIAPWWELDNMTQMHICTRCCSHLCEQCAHLTCIMCSHNRFITFDIYQQLVTVYARGKKMKITPHINYNEQNIYMPTC